MEMESPPGSARSSPEAEVGMRVEDLWEIQEPQLSPSEKLNSCFDSIFVSAFPQAPSSQVVEIPSDSSLADAVEILSKNRIVSSPVRNLKAPANASWIDRYIGIVEFAGITVWLLHQSEMAASERAIGSPSEGPAATDGITAKLNIINKAAESMGGTFLETLTTSDFYKKTKVQDIAGSFRWAPFLALQKSDSFLTMLLLLSKHRMKSLPVVVLGEEKIDNIITQSAVVHMLAECVGLHWFESWGRKELHELGLPSNRNKLIKVLVRMEFKEKMVIAVGSKVVEFQNGNKGFVWPSLLQEILLIAGESRIAEFSKRSLNSKQEQNLLVDSSDSTVGPNRP